MAAGGFKSMALLGNLSAYWVPSRRQRRGLPLVFCAFAVALMDAVAFLGTSSREPWAVTQQPRVLANGPLPPIGDEAGPLPRPPRRAGALPAQILAPALAATPALGGRAGGAARGSRLARRFFGGKSAKGKEDEEEEAPQELTEAQKASLEKIQSEVDEFKALAEEKRSAHDRLKLEFSNYRTRTRTELSAERGKAAIPIIKELLPIADEYDLALQNLKIETEGEEAISNRFGALFGKIFASWKEIGVEKLVAEGAEFNPELHEAVTMIPSDKYAADVVCNELRAGWVLRTFGKDEPQVLRPSLVCVSAGPGPS